MSGPQPGILTAIPDHARYLEFGLSPDADPAPVLRELASLNLGQELVFGFGFGLVGMLGAAIGPLRGFRALSGPGCEIPSTQADIWCWIRGDDRGYILHRSRAIVDMLEPAFRLDALLDGFKYGIDREIGLDLSGYEDGTENPTDADAIEAAVAQGLGAGLDGSSFVAVQQWVHDLDHFESLPQSERDHVFGRRLSDNEEMEDAPESAHVKRTAQESFDPEAFVLRRSMPWADGGSEGLVFVAFGKSFNAFEALLHRMTGGEDGVIDGLFRFTRPVTGGYYWCPPVSDGKLDLSALGL
jgi:putative iron-dependent peroxidase